MQIIPVVPSDDIEQAAWIRTRLRPFMSYQAGSVIPNGFDAYARIDHHERTGLLPPELAKALVRVLATKEPIWLALWEGYGSVDSDPKSRSLAILTAVGPVIADREPLPGPSIPPQRPRSAPRIHHEARAYLLYRGAPGFVPGWWDGPNLWWPDDRSWCVASEIDLPWTYVGGSEALIADVLADPRLGAKPLSLDESTLARDHPELRQRT